MGDPARGLREKARVVRQGGTVSAGACFCRTDGLPHYHGRYPLPGNRRIDELSHKLWHVWRSTIRPRLLGIDVSAVSQDLLGEFKAAGLQQLQINGHLELTSPGDDRIEVDEGAAYTLTAHKAGLERLVSWRKEHGEELAVYGFSDEEFEELITLKTARIDYLEGDPARVREVMEVYTLALLYVKGARPTTV